jgi:hypothetical protein
MRLTGHVVRTGEMRNGYKILVGEPEGKNPLGRPKRRWEDNIRTDLREMWWEDMECIHLAQDRHQWQVLLYKVMNLRVPWKAENFLTSWVTVSFSRRTLLHDVSQSVSYLTRSNIVTFFTRSHWFDIHVKYCINTGRHEIHPACLCRSPTRNLAENGLENEIFGLTNDWATVHGYTVKPTEQVIRKMKTHKTTT